MNKGINAVIAVVLILLITVGIAMLAYTFASDTFDKTTDAGTRQVGSVSESMGEDIEDILEGECIGSECCGNGEVGYGEICELGDTIDCSELSNYETQVIECLPTCLGYDDSLCVEIVIPNIDPVADFSWIAVVGGQIEFTDQSIDSDGTIVSWLWNSSNGVNSSVQNPTYLYQDYVNSYTVTLTVTDNRGGIHTKTESVSISSINECRTDSHCLIKYSDYPICVNCDTLFGVCITNSGDRKYYTCDLFNQVTGAKQCILHTNSNSCTSCSGC
ncbi:MAG: PKD domain-containing protein [Nanoarchaeota archaeon]|nr:PKD domain-containing protein [Nanoarchaeota archaeon]